MATLPSCPRFRSGRPARLSRTATWAARRQSPLRATPRWTRSSLHLQFPFLSVARLQVDHEKQQALVSFFKRRPALLGTAEPFPIPLRLTPPKIRAPPSLTIASVHSAVPALSRRCRQKEQLWVPFDSEWIAKRHTHMKKGAASAHPCSPALRPALKSSASSPALAFLCLLRPHSCLLPLLSAFRPWRCTPAGRSYL